MTSSIFHRHFLQAMKEVTSLIDHNQPEDAARRLKEADRFAVHAADMYYAEITKELLTTKYGVDWTRIYSDNHPK